VKTPRPKRILVSRSQATTTMDYLTETRMKKMMTREKRSMTMKMRTLLPSNKSL
jgi:hypothetical protein